MSGKADRDVGQAITILWLGKAPSGLGWVARAYQTNKDIRSNGQYNVA